MMIGSTSRLIYSEINQLGPTNTTTPTNLFSTNIPGGMLGTSVSPGDSSGNRNFVLKITCCGHIDSNGTGSLKMELIYGGSAISTIFSAHTFANVAEPYFYVWETIVTMVYRDSLSQKRGSAFGAFWCKRNTANGTDYMQYSNETANTIDTTVDQTLTATATWSAANAGLSLTNWFATVELLK